MTPRRWASIGIVLAAAALYLPAVDDYFVQDDFGVVWLLSQKPWSAFFGWFGRTWMDDIWGYTPDEIRPFPAVSYQLAAMAGAGSPVLNHLFNIGFHAGTALLVFAAGVRAAGLSLPAAVCAALAFALLPAHSETVAWVTGRVDSMPALFYLAAFLVYVRWRATAGARLYAWSLALFFVALFCKQNTVTFVPAIVMYDLVMARQTLRDTWAAWRRYLPFVALTAGFLLLRYVLFGEVARESALNAGTIELFLQMTGRHLRRLAAGQVFPAATVAAPVLTACVAACVLAFRSDVDRGRAWRAAVYFGVIWTALGIAPTLVSGYESPRHIYLASVGSALATGLAVDIFWHARPRRLMQPVTAAAVGLLLASHAVGLHASVRDWGVRAAVSREAVTGLEREAMAAPPGSLILLGVSARSWEWALPYATKPPFTRVDLAGRVTLLYPSVLHCCRSQWEHDARQALASWADRADASPLIVCAWDARSGTLSRLTDREEPFLREALLALREIPDVSAFHRGLMGLIEAAAPRGTARPH